MLASNCMGNTDKYETKWLFNWNYKLVLCNCDNSNKIIMMVNYLTIL